MSLWVAHEGRPRASLRIWITVGLSHPFGAVHTTPPPLASVASPLQHPRVSQRPVNLVINSHQLGGEADTNEKEWHLIVTFSQPPSVWGPGLYSLLVKPWVQERGCHLTWLPYSLHLKKHCDWLSIVPLSRVRFLGKNVEEDSMYCRLSETEKVLSGALTPVFIW